MGWFRLLAICFGGALGTAVRYGVGVWALRAMGTSFPYGTLIVNVAGSFLIGMVMHVALTTELIAPTLRLTLTTGFMGGLTTYSSFNYETLAAFQRGAWRVAALNIGVTLAACLAAGMLGFVGARALVGR